VSFNASAEVMINQLGFVPQGQKQAIVIDPKQTQFTLTDMDGTEVFSAKLGAVSTWQPSMQKVAIADFSALTTPGRYRFMLGDKLAAEFSISTSAYLDVLAASSKAYYFNRSGITLEKSFAGQWARPAGHVDDRAEIHISAASNERPTGTVVRSAKGWYDAGDYNKYVVNSAITLYTLLDALQQFPRVFASLELNIPESGDAVPDLLNEINWNLDWLLSMQDPFDGGVYHKLTTLKFSGHVMPHEATAPRYLVQKSTGASLDFAAVTAFAARVLAAYEGYEQKSAVLLQAAKQAWMWAEAHPDLAYVQPEDVNTGTYIYPNETFVDEKFWAAVELAISTGELNYLSGINLDTAETGIPSWDFVAPLGWMSLSQAQGENFKVYSQTAKTKLKTIAKFMLAEFNTSAFATSMGTFEQATGGAGADFSWGSNGVLANHNLLLFHAYADELEKVIPVIQGNVDYLLGKNATGYSFVTGFGTKSSQNIHHRPSWADDVAAPVPGFLVGGPHSGQQDNCPGYPSKLAALSYLDDTCSYATNEVAINWNAPLVFSLALLNQVYAGESISTRQ
jgi:endoglucanase